MRTAQFTGAERGVRSQGMRRKERRILKLEDRPGRTCGQ